MIWTWFLQGCVFYSLLTELKRKKKSIIRDCSTFSLNSNFRAQWECCRQGRTRHMMCLIQYIKEVYFISQLLLHHSRYQSTALLRSWRNVVQNYTDAGQNIWNAFSNTYCFFLSANVLIQLVLDLRVVWMHEGESSPWLVFTLNGPRSPKLRYSVP